MFYFLITCAKWFFICSITMQHSVCVDQYSVIMFIVHRQTVNMTLGVQMFANSTVIHSVINQASWSCPSSSFHCISLSLALSLSSLPFSSVAIFPSPSYVLSCLAKCQCVCLRVFALSVTVCHNSLIHLGKLRQMGNPLISIHGRYQISLPTLLSAVENLCLS